MSSRQFLKDMTIVEKHLIDKKEIKLKTIHKNKVLFGKKEMF